MLEASIVDHVRTGLTPCLPDAAGCARALSETSVPYFITFLIRKDGKLMDGTWLNDAIDYIDSRTVDHPPMFYQVNCVHPRNVLSALDKQPNRTKLVRERFLGLEANGSDMSPEELDALNHCKDYKNSPIPESERTTEGKGSLYSGSLTSFMSKLLTSKTCFGFTTGGHTGEDVFLAAYHPDKASLPIGMHTNIELNAYLCALFGMDRDKLDELTAENFAPHTEVFEDYKCEIIPAKDEKGSPSLVVKNKKKQINITPFSNIVTIGKKGQEEIRLNSVVVYVDKNNTFYLPEKLAEYLK